MSSTAYTGPRSAVGNVLSTDASMTANPGVSSSIPAWSHTFVEIGQEIMSSFIPLSSAESFKKFQAKVCAQSTG